MRSLLAGLVGLTLALAGTSAAQTTAPPRGQYGSPETTAAPPAQASATDLAKQTQNPVADLISVPFQHNFNFNTGPNDKTVWVMNVQPVIPITLTKDWNLITRWITPIINQPSLAPGVDAAFGLGDINPSFFLSPAGSKEFIWGIGPTFTFPTASTRELGAGKWSLGPTAVALTMQGPWVVGALINNQWSVAGWGDENVNQMLLQPFVNYNFPGGLYLTSAPIITADWNAESSQRWIVPLGGRRRQDLPPRQAAGEHAALGVLQRREARQRPGLAVAVPDTVPVSEVRSTGRAGRGLRIGSAVLIAVALAGCASTTPNVFSPPPYADLLSQPQRLQPVLGASGAAEWEAPLFDLRKYDKVLLERIQVRVAGDANHQAIDPADLKSLVDYFHQAIVKALGPAYPVVTKPGPGVLRARIMIYNLVPTEALAGSADEGKRGAAPYLGRTGLAVQFIDSQTGEVVAEYADERFGRKYVTDTSQGAVAAATTGVTDYVKAFSTWAYAQQAFDAWAAQFRQRLDKIHGR